MKIYISVPITGRLREDVEKDIEKAQDKLFGKFDDVISPFYIAPKENMPYSYYMGKDIEALLGCDAIYMCKGWQSSKGCMAEFEMARIYGIQIRME